MLKVCVGPEILLFYKAAWRILMMLVPRPHFKKQEDECYYHSSFYREKKREEKRKEGRKEKEEVLDTDKFLKEV